MKPTPPDHLPTNRPVTSIHEYCSCILAYIACGASIATGTYTQYFSCGILWMIPYVLLYLHLAYHLGQRFRQYDPRKVTRILPAVGVVHCGLDMALFGFSVVSSLMFLLVLSFTVPAIGSLRLPGIALLVSANNALPVAVLVTPPLPGSTPVEVAVVSILFCGLYICTAAFFGHQQGLRLARVHREIARGQGEAARLAYNLAKYPSPRVWKVIFGGRKSVYLETQRKELTVFLSNTRGFTELSEGLGVEALTDLFNDCLNETSKTILKCGGTIDKFVDDCVMVLFGDPSTQGAGKDTVATASMGIAVRKHMKALRQRQQTQSTAKPLEIRMDVNTGHCTVDNFGADTYVDYTIIGRRVNLTGHLESAPEAGGILVPHETCSLIKDVIMCRDKGQVAVKGSSHLVQICQAVNSHRDLGTAPNYVEHELPGLSTYLGTNNIQNCDKEQVVQALRQAVERLHDRVIP